jgi:type IV pilus assembly protein PilY1
MMIDPSMKGLAMKISLLRNVAFYAAALVAADSSFAVVAQEPLLSKTVNVRPNIALVLDTSGSMDWECVYAKHVSDALIKENPGSTNLPGFHVDCIDSDDPRQSSPVNNLLFYNPKKVYVPGYVGGVPQANANVGNSSIVELYLPKAGKDPTTYTTSNAIKNTSDYNRYEVTTTKFRLNGSNTSGNSNPFGNHNGSRTDCAADPCTFAEERQNIANWRAFHIDRIKSAKTGLSGAFASQADNFRLAYGDINGSPNTMTDFGVAKSAFYTWLDGRTPNGGTPLRTALNNVGKYYQSNANNGPWGSKPWSPPSGETAASHLSCRRSYSLLITDGFYTDGAPSSVGDVDSTKGPKYTHALDSSKTYTYTPGDKNDVRNKGKSDKTNGSSGTADTLADIAMKYWVTDLRGDLANDNGKGDPSDPPFWQNMTSYMVSFGAPGKMTDAEVASAKAGTLAWAVPTLNTVTTIDDMRHAAHNGGGDFLTVTDAAQFATDLGNVIGSIASQQFSQAGVAASAVTLTAGTKKFVPYYTSGTWWGNVQMVNLTANGDSNGVAWQVIATDGNGQPTGATTLPAPASRNIVVWTDAAKQGLDFTFANINLAANSLKGTNVNTQISNTVTSDVVDYLRGVRTKEGAGMRKRPAVLGDIVNSTPAFIKNNTNPQYEKLPVATPGLTSYAAYMASKAARTEGVLFVGANDGMLHAFGEGYGASVGGREVFAYVPRSVLGKLQALTDTGYTYAHTYTVDGPLTEVDAYLTTPNLTGGGSSTGWRNLIVGTTGAGAKSVFALNATSPLAMNGKAVLWEINPDPAFPVLAGNSTTSFQELGSVLSAPQSGITASGDWVTIFGNGYDSKSGKSSLFVVETGTGKLLKEIKTDNVTGNGLGGVRLVYNAKQQIIGAYAGDLKGRLWKFDLSTATTGGWALGNGGIALFTALSGSTALPITAQPAVLERTDQSSYLPSYLVTVATGKLFEAGDPAVTTPVQAAYALWDRKPFGSAGSDSIAESQLEGLKAVAVAAGIDPTTGTTINGGGITSFYTVAFVNPAVTTLDWATRRGWKLTLDVFAGQRDIYPVQIQGDVVKIDTVAPQASSSSCQASSSNALSFYINPLTGSCRVGGTLDTNADGKIDASDTNVCAYTSLADGTDVVLTILDPSGVDTGVRDVQNSSGHIKVRTGNGPPLGCSDPGFAAGNLATCCSDPVFAAAHEDQCKITPSPPDCTDAAYRAAHGGCAGSTLNRSWRQLFPRAN